MRRSGRSVQNDTQQPNLRIEFRKTLYRRRYAAGYIRSIHYQHNRQLQQLGNLGRAAFVRASIHSIEQPHDAFDHGHVGMTHGFAEQGEVGLWG